VIETEIENGNLSVTESETRRGIFPRSWIGMGEMVQCKGKR